MTWIKINRAGCFTSSYQLAAAFVLWVATVRLLAAILVWRVGFSLLDLIWSSKFWCWKIRLSSFSLRRHFVGYWAVLSSEALPLIRLFTWVATPTSHFWPTVICTPVRILLGRSFILLWQLHCINQSVCSFVAVFQLAYLYQCPYIPWSVVVRTVSFFIITGALEIVFLRYPQWSGCGLLWDVSFDKEKKELFRRKQWS